jgi:hypothetical protein
MPNKRKTKAAPSRKVGKSTPKAVRSGRNKTPAKPRTYNRLWHLDADGRRYHGARRWESEAIETFVELASKVDFLYPPDWSDAALVAFRVANLEIPFALIRTDKPTLLRLILHIRSPQEAATLQRRLGIYCRAGKSPDERNQAELTIRTPHRLGTYPFRVFFEEYVDKFRKMLGLPPGPSREERLLPL